MAMYTCNKALLELWLTANHIDQSYQDQDRWRTAFAHTWPSAFRLRGVPQGLADTLLGLCFGAEIEPLLRVFLISVLTS